MLVLRSLGCTIALCLAMLAAPAGAATSVADWEHGVAKQTNVERKAHDRHRAVPRACLKRYATAWAKHIALKNKLVHRSSASLGAILRACNLHSIGENLAMGQRSSKGVVTDWMHSKPHRANLLNRAFRQQAVGAYKYKGRWWTVQLLAQK